MLYACRSLKLCSKNCNVAYCVSHAVLVFNSRFSPAATTTQRATANADQTATALAANATRGGTFHVRHEYGCVHIFECTFW